MFGQDAALKAAAITQGQRIYAARHSYFLQVPGILAELTQADKLKDEVWVGSKYIGGSKSLYHWNLKDGENKAKEALQAGAADVLILTPVYLPDEGIEKFANFGLAKNPNLRITVMEFWLPYDAYEPHFYDPPLLPKPERVDHNAQTAASLQAMHERYFKEMDSEIRRVNAAVGKTCVFAVPVGQAILKLRERIIAGTAPGLKSQEDLFTDPLGHPKPVLQVLLAYAHHAVIYRKSPVGLPMPQALQAAKLSPGDTTALNQLLQELAWNAVVHHPLSAVSATP